MNSDAANESTEPLLSAHHEEKPNLTSRLNSAPPNIVLLAPIKDAHFLTLDEGNRLVVTEDENCFTHLLDLYWNNYVLLILTSAFMFASFFASIKALSQDISEYQMVAVTYSLSAMTLFGTNLTRGISPFQPRTKVPIMIFRGLVGGLGLICVTYSTYILPLSDAAFLSNSYPAVTAVLVWLIGMEPLNLLTWIGVLGCILGNALVAQPPFLFGGDSKWDPTRRLGVLSAIIGNVFIGSAFTIVRYAGDSVDSINFTAYFHLASCFLCIPFVVLKYPLPIAWPSSKCEWAIFVIPYFVGLIGQVVQTRGFQIGSPTKATVLFMTNMLISATIGAVFFFETMALSSIIGAAVITVSVVLVTAQRSTKVIKDDDALLLSEPEI